MKSESADVAIIGAGIVGLAFAYAHATKGRRVVVFERTERALGASIRNFGLIWPIGQPFGQLYNRALRSRNIWADIAKRAGLWHAATGSLHLAYHPSEIAVLEELVSAARNHDVGCEMLTAAETLEKSRAVKSDGVLGALWSPVEINIDPRQALWTLPKWMERELGVTFRFGEQVNAISMPNVETKDEKWTVSELVVCSGQDFETLYPKVFAASGLTRCKLQMMRTAPQANGWELGPSLCAGLTLTHYDSFKSCPSLPALKKRFEQEFPFHVKNGIHVLLSQTSLGELTIGDSHEYGVALTPFDREEINKAILDYLNTFAVAPSFEIAERWHGIYPKLAGKTEFIAAPEEGVTIVNGLSGAGMTFSFGLADEVVRK
jgi:FAD dependent oxidoreductase TIGR03364